MEQVLLALIATIVPLATVLVSVRGLSHSTPTPIPETAPHDPL